MSTPPPAPPPPHPPNPPNERTAPPCLRDRRVGHHQQPPHPRRPHPQRIGGVDAVPGRHPAALVDQPHLLAGIPLPQPVGQPSQVLPPVDVRVVQPETRLRRAPERLVGVRQIEGVRPQRADRHEGDQRRHRPVRPPPPRREHARPRDGQEERHEQRVAGAEVPRPVHRHHQQHGRGQQDVRRRRAQPGDHEHRRRARQPQGEHAERCLHQQRGRQVVPAVAGVDVPEQEPLPGLVLEAELEPHPVPVRLRERQEPHQEPAGTVHLRHPVGRRRPAQPGVDREVGRPHDGHREQSHPRRRPGRPQQRPQPGPTAGGRGSLVRGAPGRGVRPRR